MVAFGVMLRDPRQAVSLVDLRDWLGLGSSMTERGRVPTVEYTKATPTEWVTLLRTGRPRADGGVELDTATLSGIDHRLTGFAPTRPGDAYRYVPTSPVPNQPMPPAASGLLTSSLAGAAR